MVVHRFSLGIRDFLNSGLHEFEFFWIRDPSRQGRDRSCDHARGPDPFAFDPPGKESVFVQKALCFSPVDKTMDFSAKCSGSSAG